jgi:DNA-binding CsgD family transcriptional regulator
MSYAQLNDWSLSIRRLIAEIDSPQLLRTLIDELAAGVAFDTWFMAVFHKDKPPVIVDYLGMDERQETYAEGPYLLDPYYNAYVAGVGHGCFSVRQLAPDDFAKTEYYRTYYRHIGVKDEIGYILPFDDRSAGHVSLCRTAALPRFSARELRWLQAVEPVVGSLMLRRWERLQKQAPTQAAARGDLHDRLNRTLHGFASTLLTEREGEIAGLLLKGHSAKSVARVLRISPGTVRNHMKKIYAKLGVSSQAELFGRFLEALSRAEVDGASASVPLPQTAESRRS